MTATLAPPTAKARRWKGTLPGKVILSRLSSSIQWTPPAYEKGHQNMVCQVIVVGPPLMLAGRDETGVHLYEEAPFKPGDFVLVAGHIGGGFALNERAEFTTDPSSLLKEAFVVIWWDTVLLVLDDYNGEQVTPGESILWDRAEYEKRRLEWTGTKEPLVLGEPGSKEMLGKQDEVTRRLKDSGLLR